MSSSAETQFVPSVILTCFALQIGHADTCPITSSLFACSSLVVTFGGKKRHLEETLILLPERSIPWPLNLGQLITSGHVTLEFASYVVPVFPLPFQYLISVQHCVSLSLSPLPSPLLYYHFISPPFSPHLWLSPPRSWGIITQCTGWRFIHYHIKGFLMPHWLAHCYCWGWLNI